MILSVPCSSATRRNETDGENRTKHRDPAVRWQEFWYAAQHTQGGVIFSLFTTRRAAKHHGNGTTRWHVQSRITRWKDRDNREKVFHRLFFWRNR